MLMTKPLAADYLLLLFLLLYPFLNWLWLWPRLVRATAAGVPGARAADYWGTIAIEWIFTVYVLAVWFVFGRSWDSLYVGHAPFLRLGLGLALALAVILFFCHQHRTIFARPKLIESVRQKMRFADPFSPHTDAERYHFWFVAITAGICEEILYRGFLFSFLRALFSFLGEWTGIIAAMVISSIVFGCAHIYQGNRFVPRIALVGLFFAVVVVLTKSLWPAILIHAAIDLHSGELAFGVHRAASQESPGRFAADLLPDKSA